MGGEMVSPRRNAIHISEGRFVFQRDRRGRGHGPAFAALFPLIGRGKRCPRDKSVYAVDAVLY